VCASPLACSLSCSGDDVAVRACVRACVCPLPSLLVSLSSVDVGQAHHALAHAALKHNVLVQVYAHVHSRECWLAYYCLTMMLCCACDDVDDDDYDDDDDNARA
jgi:hypothetical protein